MSDASEARWDGLCSSVEVEVVQNGELHELCGAQAMVGPGLGHWPFGVIMALRVTRG